MQRLRLITLISKIIPRFLLYTSLILKSDVSLIVEPRLTYNIYAAYNFSCCV